MTESLVAIDVAKRALRVEGSDLDEDLLWRLEQATEIVIDYIKQPEHEWTPETVPGPVSAAIILVTRSLFDGEDEPISDAVRALLHRFRDPALA